MQASYCGIFDKSLDFVFLSTNEALIAIAEMLHNSLVLRLKNLEPFRYSLPTVVSKNAGSSEFKLTLIPDGTWESESGPNHNDRLGPGK